MSRTGHRYPRPARGTAGRRRVVALLRADLPRVRALFVGRGLFAEGHILFEDVPGVAKTMLSRSDDFNFTLS